MTRSLRRFLSKFTKGHILAWKLISETKNMCENCFRQRPCFIGYPVEECECPEIVERMTKIFIVSLSKIKKPEESCYNVTILKCEYEVDRKGIAGINLCDDYDKQKIVIEVKFSVCNSEEKFEQINYLRNFPNDMKLNKKFPSDVPKLYLSTFYKIVKKIKEKQNFLVNSAIANIKEGKIDELKHMDQISKSSFPTLISEAICYQYDICPFICQQMDIDDKTIEELGDDSFTSTILIHFYCNDRKNMVKIFTKLVNGFGAKWKYELAFIFAIINHIDEIVDLLILSGKISSKRASEIKTISAISGIVI